VPTYQCTLLGSTSATLVGHNSILLMIQSWSMPTKRLSTITQCPVQSNCRRISGRMKSTLNKWFRRTWTTPTEEHDLSGGLFPDHSLPTSSSAAVSVLDPSYAFCILSDDVACSLLLLNIFYVFTSFSIWSELSRTIGSLYYCFAMFNAQRQARE
jgi:hypothetical protein